MGTTEDADVFKKETRNYTVEVDPANRYGYFEHNIRGGGGGLWFENTEEGKLGLVDYDGVFELPGPIIDILREGGFIVGKEFE